jgi:hypothetical protein
MKIRAGIIVASLLVSLGWSWSAIAQAPSSQPSPDQSSTPVPENPPTKQDSLTLQTYTLPNVFSIEIPPTWFTTGDAAAGSATLTSYPLDRTASTSPQTTDIQTDILIVSESPDTYVDREISTLLSQDPWIETYGSAVVDNQTAIRIWLRSSTLPNYSQQVITFVGYGDRGTVKLVSYYNDPAPATRELIASVHRSFKLLR